MSLISFLQTHCIVREDVITNINTLFQCYCSFIKPNVYPLANFIQMLVNAKISIARDENMIRGVALKTDKEPYIDIRLSAFDDKKQKVYSDVPFESVIEPQDLTVPREILRERLGVPRKLMDRYSKEKLITIFGSTGNFQEEASLQATLGNLTKYGKQFITKLLLEQRRYELKVNYCTIEKDRFCPLYRPVDQFCSAPNNLIRKYASKIFSIYKKAVKAVTIYRLDSCILKEFHRLIIPDPEKEYQEIIEMVPPRGNREVFCKWRIEYTKRVSYLTAYALVHEYKCRILRSRIYSFTEFCRLNLLPVERTVAFYDYIHLLNALSPESIC